MSTGGWGATPSTDGPAASIGTLARRPERDQDAAEWRLVRALRHGDEAAFAELVKRHHAMLRRMARVYMADDAADGLAQDVWSSVLGRLDRLEGSPSLRVALLAILHEQAQRRRGSEAGSIPFAARWVPAAEPIGPGVDPSQFRTGAPWPGHWAVTVAEWQPLQVELLAARVTAARIEEEIARLPGAQREVVSLRDVERWTSAEVSAALRISDVQQRLLLHAARSRLRSVLDAIGQDA